MNKIKFMVDKFYTAPYQYGLAKEQIAVFKDRFPDDVNTFTMLRDKLEELAPDVATELNTGANHVEVRVSPEYENNRLVWVFRWDIEALDIFGAVMGTICTNADMDINMYSFRTFKPNYDYEMGREGKSAEMFKL